MALRILACFWLLFFSSATLAKPMVSFIDSVPNDAMHQVIVLQDEKDVGQQYDAIVAAYKAVQSVDKEKTVSHHYNTFGATHTIVVHSDGPLDTPVALQHLGGSIAAAIPSDSNENYLIDLTNVETPVTYPEAYVAEGLMLRAYNFQTYKSSKKSVFSATLVAKNANETSEFFEGQRLPIVDGVYLARDIASEPGNTIYPETFIERVKTAMKGLDDVKVRVMDKRDLEKYNMGALLGVGQGSIHDPAMLIIEYKGGEKDAAPIALAGKGITFDTGGTSLKPNTNMWQMKSDLSGAAAVAGTMHAIARQEAPINVVGIMPLAENQPGPNAIRPGDVLTTMQGTTIEIISTDAEGRLILSDAVRYVQDKYEPSMLLNIATLTGSAARALSDEYAALITRDWDLSVAMKKVGEQSGEHVWPLPLHPNHFKQLKSEIADIKNSGVGNPGASIGAAVVGTFVDEDLPWVHLDIAGVDWLLQPNEVAPVGSQGWGVRFMTQLVANEANKGN